MHSIGEGENLTDETPEHMRKRWILKDLGDLYNSKIKIEKEISKKEDGSEEKKDLEQKKELIEDAIQKWEKKLEIILDAIEAQESAHISKEDA